MEKLTTAQAAARAGVQPGTWRDYVAKGRAPKRDGEHDARTPWWYPATVDAWLADRPGQGARTDRTNRP